MVVAARKGVGGCAEEEERGGEKMYSQRERTRKANTHHHTHTYIHASCVCAAAVAVCTVVVGAVVVCRSNSSSRSRSGFRSSERGGQEEDEMKAGPGEDDD